MLHDHADYVWLYSSISVYYSLGVFFSVCMCFCVCVRIGVFVDVGEFLNFACISTYEVLLLHLSLSYYMYMLVYSEFLKVCFYVFTCMCARMRERSLKYFGVHAHAYVRAEEECKVIVNTFFSFFYTQIPNETEWIIFDWISLLYFFFHSLGHIFTQAIFKKSHSKLPCTFR